MNLLNKIICYFAGHKPSLKDIIYNKNPESITTGFGLAQPKTQGKVVFYDNKVFCIEIYECDRCGKPIHKTIYKDEV